MKDQQRPWIWEKFGYIHCCTFLKYFYCLTKYEKNYTHIFRDIDTGRYPSLPIVVLYPNYKGRPKKWEFIFLKICIYPHMFKVQSPSRCSPVDVIHLSTLFSYRSKQFWNLLILMPFSAFAVFLFHFFHMGKTFPFEDVFHPGDKKNCLGWDWVDREGSCNFGWKLLYTQHSVGECTRKSPITKWANVLKESSKKSAL